MDPSPVLADATPPADATRPADATPAVRVPGATRRRLLAELVDLESRSPRDLAGNALRAQVVLDEALAGGLDHEVGRARLVLADLAYRGDDVRGAVAEARTVLAAARISGDAVVAAHAELVLSWCMDRVGALGEALAHAVEAVRLLPDDAPGHLEVRHLLALALFSGSQSADDSYVVAFERVLAAAERCGHPDLVLLTLNNFAWLHQARGRTRDALVLARRIQDHARAHDLALSSTELETVASVLLSSGDLEGAEQVARSVFEPGVANIEARGRPEALLTLARIRQRRGDPDEALTLVEEAEGLARHRRLAEDVALATELRSELLAERGDHRGAHAALVVAHETWKRVRDQRAEDRASALHAVLETDEVRRRSEAMAELAERDALTGLWNRRHVDRVLPDLLAADRDPAGPVSVAIIDVDHFKRINDTRSHQVGDAVLTRLAELLDGAVRPPALAARLGGEEFVLVLPATGPVSARAVCESFRQLVAREDWSPLVDGVPVTVSTGLATTTVATTPAAALHAADLALYDAKRAGRNRVCARTEAPPEAPPGDRAAAGRSRGRRRPAQRHGTWTGRRPGGTLRPMVTVPFLWFDDAAEQAATLYTEVFPRSSVDHVTRYGPGGPGPEGSVLTVDFTLDGQRFVALNGGPQHRFTEAVSFQIPCADQAEVDHYWDRLSAGGEEGRCGWLKDRFGLSWQVVPAALGELLGDPDPGRSGRAMRAMLTMGRLDVAALHAAADAADAADD